MHLIYFDETGNTGNNLTDPQQPVFLLCAMLIQHNRWQDLEKALHEICAERFGEQVAADGFEIHAADIRNGNGIFRGIAVSERIAFQVAL